MTLKEKLYLPAIFTGMGLTLKHAFQTKKGKVFAYPEVQKPRAKVWRGQHVLKRDDEGRERCTACGLCAVTCPAEAITMIAAERKPDEKHLYREEKYAEMYEINMLRCIFCGLCEEACPTTAIQLTPDFELGEYKRQDLVYEKEDLLISGPGKYPEYNFYRMAGMAIDGKDKGEAENEAKPIDVKSLLP